MRQIYSWCEVRKRPWRIRWGKVVRRSLKSFLASAAYYSGVLNPCVRIRARQGALILAYHRINTREYIRGNAVMPGMFISSETFKAQVDWFRDNFQLVKLSDMIGWIRKARNWEAPLCAITFDDGWYDNYEYAVPILREYSVPATVFVIGNRIGSSEPDCWDMCFEIVQGVSNLPRDLTGNEEIDCLISAETHDRIEKARMAVNGLRKLAVRELEQVYRRLRWYYGEMLEASAISKRYRKLDWQDIRGMEKYGIEFGYHSKNHYILTQVRNEDMYDEIRLPYERATEEGVTINRIFCYPDGRYDTHVMDALKVLGYEGAVMLGGGFNRITTNPYALRRLNVHEGTASTLEELAAVIALS